MSTTIARFAWGICAFGAFGLLVMESVVQAADVLALAVGLLVLSALPGAYLWKRNPHDLAQLAALGLSFLLVAMVGLCWYGTPTPFALGVGAAAALSLGAIAAWTVVDARRSDPLPDPLQLRSNAGAAREIAGVQLLLHNGSTANPLIRLSAQNCIDVERTLRLEFGVKPSSVLAVPPVELRLPAGAVGVVEWQLAGPPGIHATVQILPSVIGAGGRRIRRWHAVPYQPPIAEWWTVLAALTGKLAVSKGIRANARLAEGSPPAPLVRAVITWTPDAATLDEVRASFS